MTAENEKEVSVESAEPKEDAKQETPVVEEKSKPIPKIKSRKKRTKKAPVKPTENPKKEAPVKKSTGFKKTEIKIMQGRPRSRFKVDDKKEEKPSKDNRIAKRSKGIDFDG